MPEFVVLNNEVDNLCVDNLYVDRKQVKEKTLNFSASFEIKKVMYIRVNSEND